MVQTVKAIASNSTTIDSKMTIIGKQMTPADIKSLLVDIALLMED